MLRILALLAVQEPKELPAELLLLVSKVATMGVPGDFAEALAVRGRRMVHREEGL
jgi:hypothetical protein